MGSVLCVAKRASSSATDHFSALKIEGSRRRFLLLQATLSVTLICSPPKAKNRETEVSGFRFFFLSLTLFEAIINENNLH